MLMLRRLCLLLSKHSMPWRKPCLRLASASYHHQKLPHQPPGFEWVLPDRSTSWEKRGLLFDSPHSGRWYPSHAEWNHKLDLDLIQLRKGEDAYMDEVLCKPCATAGIPLLLQPYPRCYIDVNRPVDDLDPSLLEEPWPFFADPTEKSVKGIGLIRRRVRPGTEIYDQALKTAEVLERLTTVYWPYHGALRMMLTGMLKRHGTVWHVNWHSMKSLGNKMTPDPGAPRPDFVVSNMDGDTAGHELTYTVVDFLREKGFIVRVNTPYKGGYIIRTYASREPGGGGGGGGRATRDSQKEQSGVIDGGIHSLQVEINRALYVDEEKVTLYKGKCEKLLPVMSELCQVLVEKAPRLQEGEEEIQ